MTSFLIIVIVILCAALAAALRYLHVMNLKSSRMYSLIRKIRSSSDVPVKDDEKQDGRENDET